MAPAGGGHEMGESGGSPVRRGVDRIPSGGAAAGQDLGASRKRKAAVMCEDPSSLVGNGEHLEVAYVDSQKLLKEIEDLKAEIDKDVKGMQCPRKRNEEVQGKNDGMRKRNEELRAQNDVLAKQNKELRAQNDDLAKGNEELRSMRKWNGELQTKNVTLTVEDLRHLFRM